MNSIAENFDDDNMHPDQFRTRENGIRTSCRTGKITSILNCPPKLQRNILNCMADIEKIPDIFQKKGVFFLCGGSC